MHPFLDTRLHIGSRGDVLDPRKIYDSEIQAIIDLAAEEPPLHLRDIPYFRIPLHDDDSNPQELLQLALQTIQSCHHQHLKTLLVCSLGMSRSPALASTAIALLTDESPANLLSQYATNSPLDVSPSLWNSLLNLH